jgi:epoxyqueuosine reductase QueG
MCRFLEDKGYPTINFPSTAPQDSGPVGRLVFADFSHRHAAELAGLGQIGLNRLLITPLFGPRVWLMSVITTAELAADPMLSEEVCPGRACNICIEKCPEYALSSDGIDVNKCLQGYGRFGLLGIIRLIREAMKEKDPDKRDKVLFGPKLWTLWMVLQYQGGPSMCNACISACPVGWKADHTARISVSAETPTVPVHEFDREKQ